MTDEAKKADDAASVEVIAVERGHDGVTVREENETFFVPRARLKEGSTWFVELAKAEGKKAEKPTSSVPPGAGPKPK